MTPWCTVHYYPYFLPKQGAAKVLLELGCLGLDPAAQMTVTEMIIATTIMESEMTLDRR